jgi:hypothetical protein
MFTYAYLCSNSPPVKIFQPAPDGLKKGRNKGLGSKKKVREGCTCTCTISMANLTRVIVYCAVCIVQLTYHYNQDESNLKVTK